MKNFTLGQNLKDKYNQLWTVQRRTAKTVWVYGSTDKETKRCKIQTSFDVEYFKPYGNYSQAPCVFAHCDKADKEEAPVFGKMGLTVHGCF